MSKLISKLLIMALLVWTASAQAEPSDEQLAKQKREIYQFYWAQKEACHNEFFITITLGPDLDHPDVTYFDPIYDLVHTQLDINDVKERVRLAVYKPNAEAEEETLGYEYNLSFKLNLPPGMPAAFPLSPKNKDFPAFAAQYAVFQQLTELEATTAFKPRMHPKWRPLYTLTCTKHLSGVTGTSN